MDKLKKIVRHRLFLPLVALIFLIGYNAIFVDKFFLLSIINGQLHGRMIDILNRAASLVIVSVGMTFVIATGGIDISVGSIMAITGATTAYIVGGAGDGVPRAPLWLAIAAGLLVGLICGLWNGFLVSKLKIQPIIATLILQTAGRGIAMLITQGQIITVYYKPFSYFGNHFPGSPLPTTIFLALTVIIVVGMLLKRTSISLFVQSVGINKKASHYSGINVNRVMFMTYIFSGLCAAVGGLIEVSRISAADANNAGLLFESSAIMSVALGGTLLKGGRFSLGGSIIGAITIQTLTTTLYARGVSSEQLPFIQGVVIILICLLQSELFRSLFVMNRKQQDKSEERLVKQP